MTRKSLMIIAGLGSAALLLGAFGFQALGYAPCKLCLWQRWPHGVAILAGLVALVWAARPVALVGLLGAVATSGLGLYHTGVERGWWEGPTSCSGSGEGLSGLSGADLLSTDIAETVVMCDEVAWMFAGLSMASWNMILSAVLAVIWAKALASRR